jgi:predicted transcriptional regulator
MKLTDTQRALLEAAAQHPQKKLINFPDTLKGGARIKVLTAMRNAQLIEASASEPEVYVATATGLEAIGITVQAPRAKREGTKQSVLIELLKRSEGATLAQMTEATNWQVHTIRGAMAGALKKKLGLEITSEKQTGADRIYRITTTTV